MSQVVQTEKSFVLLAFEAVSPDRDSIGRVHVVDGESGEELYRLDSVAPTGALAFDDSTGELLAAVDGGTLRTIDVATGNVISEVETAATSGMSTTPNCGLTTAAAAASAVAPSLLPRMRAAPPRSSTRAPAASPRAFR